MPFRRALRLAVLCTAPLAIAAAPPANAEAPATPPPAADFKAILIETTNAIMKSDFAALDALETRLRTTRAMQPNGVWGLRTFYFFADRQLGGQGRELAEVEREEAFLQRWLAASPGSLAAPVLLGRAYTHHAFLLRGGSYADQVRPEQWAGYRDYLQRAQAEFARNPAAQRTNPGWYGGRLVTATVDSMPPEEFVRLLRESLALAPDYNEPLHAAVHYASPKWGGSPAQLDRMAQVVLKDAGPEAYTVLYTEALRTMPCGCEYHAEDLRIRWPVFDQGVRSRLEKYGSPHYFNEYAALACNAGHDSLRDALRPKLIEQGKQPDTWQEFAQKPACTRWIEALPAPVVAKRY